MDWSRTKSIFIFTFLFLNMFLGYQLYEKQTQGNLNILSEATLQEVMQANRIELNIDNQDETMDGGPITGIVRNIPESSLDALERQTATMLDGTTIYSELDNPYKMVDVNLRASVEAFLQQYVFKGEQYAIAKYNEEENFIGLYQTYEGKKIDQYEQNNYHLVLHVNEEFKIESYVQSYMNISKQGTDKELLSPLKAVERLLNEQYIGANTTIEDAELGYYSMLQPDANFQVFAPVWRITANDEYYYVNALDGGIQPIS